MRVHPIIVVAILAGLGACGGESLIAPPRPPAEAVELLVTRTEPPSREPLFRDEPLVLRFSAPLDPATIGPATVRVIRREGGQDQPVTVRVEGDRLVLSPPAPFGFPPAAELAVVVEGFPSLLAPRSRDGRSLSRRYRTTFRTARTYRPDIAPPRVESIEVVPEEGGGFRVHVRFTEPVDPDSVAPGRTLHVTEEETGEEIPGRVLADRRAVWFRFLPAARPAGREVRVVLTSGVRDLAGNSLYVFDGAEKVLRIPASGHSPDGSVTEDFTTRDMLDPAETTAVWAGDRDPGVLLAEPAATSLHLGAPSPVDLETYLALGAGEVRIAVLLGPEELGPPREITGITWTPAGAGFVPAEYSGLEVRLTPTDRSSLDGTGADPADSEPVLRLAPWRIGPEEWERVNVHFLRPFTWDGGTPLLLEVRVGPGDHTNFLRAGRGAGPRVRVERNGSPEDVRPVLSLHSFSWSPVATSRFYDSGEDDPAWQAPLLNPARLPDGVHLRLRLQGARRLGADGRSPAGDPDAVTPWVEDPALLDGCRWVRFRMEFEGVSLAGDAAVDDIVLPFRAR